LPSSPPFFIPSKYAGEIIKPNNMYLGIKTKERKRDHGEGMWKGWDKGETAQKVYRVQKV
jgi:hypothetical protein